MTSPEKELERREGRLRDCIADLYRVFRGYRLPTRMEPDPCFPGWCHEGPLRAAPLAELPESAFRSYRYKALTTWGTVSDFKHFLPRILELLPREPRIGIDAIEPWLVFDKLRYAGWDEWQSAETESLNRFFDALWSVLLSQTPHKEHAWQLSPWLHDYSHALDDVSRFLDQWQTEAANSETGLFAAVHLANSIDVVFDDLWVRDKLGWPGETPEKQVIRWLASNDVLELLESAFFRWSDTVYVGRLSNGHDCLCRWRNHRRS